MRSSEVSVSGKTTRKSQAQRTPPLPRRRPDIESDAGPAPQPAAPAGLYRNLGIQDETSEFSKLASRERSEDIRGVVVHRTESPTMESTRNSYRTQIEDGNHVGAHYLIGEDGATSLTVPTDQVTAHVRGNQEKEWRGANAWSVGIENVGMASQINRRGDVRAQVEALDLPPAMRARLLAQDDKTLKATLADSEYEIHTDITGPQKRSNWNLVSALTEEHGLDMATDVRAHESVDYKTLGEGEPIREFLTARASYDARVTSAEERLAALRADPSVDPAQLASLSALVQRETATRAALAVDKTPAENNALEGERILGEPGEASRREALRTEFYDQFWARSTGLDAAITK